MCGMDAGTWGPSLPMFKARLAAPFAKPFVENLYFTLLFVVRAVTKVGCPKSLVPTAYFLWQLGISGCLLGEMLWYRLNTRHLHLHT